MEIVLNKIILLNFKGARDLGVEFSNSTYIFGRNRSYKSTIYDAFWWVLFGKDSSGRTDFDIKTLDKNGVVIHKLVHAVTLYLTVNGKEICLERQYREKWVTRRGEAEEKMSGHEQSFKWNLVPLTASEYQQKISQSLIGEELFKLITSPTYFNDLDWTRRRKILIDIAGPIDDAMILEGIEGGKVILDIINSDKSISEYLKQVQAKKNLLKTELKGIPPRIEELQRLQPEPKDFAAIELEIAAAENKLAQTEQQMQSKAEAVEAGQNQYKNLQQQKFELENKAQAIVTSIQADLNKPFYEEQNRKQELDLKLKSVENQILQIQNQVSASEQQISETAIKIELLRGTWKDENEKVFAMDENELNCPTCGQALEEGVAGDKKSKYEEKFNTDKLERLNQINASGKKLAQLKTDLVSGLTKTKMLLDEKQQLQSDLVSELKEVEEKQKLPRPSPETMLGVKIAASLELKELSTKISELEILLLQKPDVPKLKDLISQRKVLHSELDRLRADLALRTEITKINARIEQLKQQERKLGQEIADYERTEFAVTEFTRIKMELVQNRVNSKFGLVRFRMYSDQINGGQDPDCVTLVDGVPYASANTASQINAGLDIINTLSNHYGNKAPVFIDNCESVMIPLEINMQTIKLIASACDLLQSDIDLRQYPQYKKVLNMDIPEYRDLVNDLENENYEGTVFKFMDKCK